MARVELFLFLLSLAACTGRGSSQSCRHVSGLIPENQMVQWPSAASVCVLETVRWWHRYNSEAPTSSPDWRFATLSERLGRVGQGTWIQPPFYCDFGSNIHTGANVKINYDCVILDGARVEIGDNSRLGPGVHIYTYELSDDTLPRRGNYLVARPVIIGKDVTMDGRVIIMPGVCIGDGVIIGAGAMVYADVGAGSKIGMGAVVNQHGRVGAGAVVGDGAMVMDEVPPGVTVVGNPARPWTG